MGEELRNYISILRSWICCMYMSVCADGLFGSNWISGVDEWLEYREKAHCSFRLAAFFSVVHVVAAFLLRRFIRQAKSKKKAEYAMENIAKLGRKVCCN